MIDRWETAKISSLFQELRSSERGLRSTDAAERLIQYGPNKLPEEKGDGVLQIFFRQFKSPLIYILVTAGLLILAIGDVVDAGIIFAVLFFNAIVGSIQEGRAQNTLRALKLFSETKATVLRDDKEVMIPDAEVVPGDILMLQEGEKIAADARMIDSVNLKVDESALTGESVPVYKMHHLPNGSEAVGRQQVVNKTTTVVAGNGRAIVVATGAQTAIGTIATRVSTIDTEIPLRANIRYLSRLIILAVAGISVVIFLLGIFLGNTVTNMFTTIVTLAVSIVPEGLPIVVTLILAVGVRRMSKRHALVKRLQAVEALGQARVLAVDKTGTITKNEMVVQKVYAGKTLFEIGGVGYEPSGSVMLDRHDVDAANHPELLLAGKIAAFGATARVMYSASDDRWRIAGDPTEAALLILSQKLGFHKGDLVRESPLVEEIPFDYHRKYHAVTHRVDEKNFLAVVGAPEVILKQSHDIWMDGEQRTCTTEDRARLSAVMDTMSRDGLRVVGFAYDPDAGRDLNPEQNKHLCFVGFYGMRDAARPEAVNAIRKAIGAGIHVVMITGDYPVTAQAIAKETGIWQKNSRVLTGQEVDQMTDDVLQRSLRSVAVFARVNPEHKLRIIEAYRARGEVVAMTGDGVNDAPSLVAADLGVAMGSVGTEVAKEAADIVLLDDNLESIVAAIEEGRSIYKTIKKVILYLFSTSIGEVCTIVGALLLGFPLPILPAQIIWLNFVTDGFLDVSLAMEPKEDGLLDRHFEKPKKYLVDKRMGSRMLLMSVVMAVGTLIVFSQYVQTDLTKAWTVTLTLLSAYQWFNAWNCRSEHQSLFRMHPLSNLYLFGATFLVITLHLLALYTPFLQRVLRTVPLDMSDWLKIIPVAATIVVAEEIRKAIFRWRSA